MANKVKMPLKAHLRKKYGKQMKIAGALLVVTLALLIAPITISYISYFISLALTAVTFLYLIIVTPTLNSGAVPDSLLTSIAESSSIPEPLKMEVAKLLKEQGSITVAQLHRLDFYYSEELAAKERKKSEGYLKMMTFIEPNKD